MDSKIADLIEVLKDNSLCVKVYDAPATIKESKYDIKHLLKEEHLVKAVTYKGDDLFEFISFELVPDSLTRYELNGHWDATKLEEYLESVFEEFRESAAKKNIWQDRSLKKNFADQIKESRYQLKVLLYENEKNNISEIDLLFKRKIECCQEVIRFLNSQIVVIKNLVEDTPAKVKQARPNRPQENLTRLTQNQIVILFHYLREQKIVGNEMQKNMYAEHIAELTGFSNEKLRQDLSSIEKESYNIDSIKFTKKDFSDVSKTLENVVTAIKKAESERKFS